MNPHPKLNSIYIMAIASPASIPLIMMLDEDVLIVFSRKPVAAERGLAHGA